jgi:hypothetical protein
MTLTPKQQADLDAISADFGGAATGAVGSNWTRNPGAPVVPGVTCYDNEAESKRYAAQGFNSSGIKCIADQNLAASLDRADAIIAAPTADAANAILGNAGTMDGDTSALASLTGWVYGEGGLGGTPYLGCAWQSLAWFIRKPGQPIGGNVSV